ncbi:hypothetical protein [Tannockella kyphosi]|uniref:hypothetical protein n=1 Tax=Tannockella kyphosi TaxID=2899121 RepID=UPI002011B77A|nr:hypothetical protein [Tannockella kyphosi]
MINQCIDKFTAEQIIYLQDYTMLFEKDILELLNYNLEDLPWSIFYNKFFQLDKNQQNLIVNKVKDFGDENEVIDIAMSLSNNTDRYNFIKKAIDKKVIFSNENIQLLVDEDKAIATLFGVNITRQPEKVKPSFLTTFTLGLMFRDLINYLIRKDKD